MSPKKLFNQTNLRIIFSITLIAVMGVSSITPAFPQIKKALDISAKEVGLLITVFTIPGILLTPILGIMADRLGRKKILVPSLFLYGIAGPLCFFTTDFTLLLTLRFVQGMGVAALGSINLTLIGDLYADQQKSEAMGYNASVLSVGTASYPAIGGALSMLGWNYPFLLAILGIPVGLAVLYYLNNPEPENPINFKDYLISTWRTIGQLPVIILFTISVITFIILYGAFLSFFPFLADHRFAASSFEIGVLMSAMSIATAFVSSQLGRLTKRFSERQLMLTAYILYPIALTTIPLANSLWTLLLPIIVFGIAQGMNLPSFISLLTGFAPLENRAAFMSVNGMVLRVGQTIGPPLMGYIYEDISLNFVFFTGSILSLVMLFLTLFFLRTKTSQNV